MYVYGTCLFYVCCFVAAIVKDVFSLEVLKYVCVWGVMDRKGIWS